MKKISILTILMLIVFALYGCQTSTTSLTTVISSDLTTDSSQTDTSIKTTTSELEELIRNNEIYQGRDISEILGITHVSGRYYFTSDDFLNEGVDAIESMGIKTIKLWFNRTPNKSYSYNSSWPTYSNDSTLGYDSNYPEYWDTKEEYAGFPMQSMVDMAKVSYFQDAFSKSRNFTTYILEASEFREVNWKNGMTDSEIASVKKEFKDLTMYLMNSQNGTGRTFLLQNWEGDNALNIQDIKTEEGQITAINGMADWLNARQDGITEGRNLVLESDPSNDVLVYGVAEMNQVNNPNDTIPQFSYKLVVDWVVPKTRMDLYSFSTWGTRLPGDEIGLLAKLDHIAEQAPDSEAFGDKNVMLGEFGAYQRTYETASHNYPQYLGDSDGAQYIANRKQLEFAFQWGVQYMLYWELYCNGFVNKLGCAKEGVCELHEDGSGQLVATEGSLKGVWLIDVEGNITPTWYYFMNQVQPQYILDEFDGKVDPFSRSTGLVYAKDYSFTSLDSTFLVNNSENIESLTYRLSNTIREFSLKVFYTEDALDNVKVKISKDGVNYETIETQFIDSGIEQYGVKSGHILLDDVIPEGYTFLQIDVLPNRMSSLKIGGVMVSSTSVEFMSTDVWNYNLDDTLETLQIEETSYLSGYGKIAFQYDFLNNLYVKAYYPSSKQFNLDEMLQANGVIRSGELESLTLEAVQTESHLDGYDAYLISMVNIPKDIKDVEIEILDYDDNELLIDWMTFENIYVRPLEIIEISQDDVNEVLEYAINWYKPITVDKKYGIGKDIPNFSTSKNILFLLTDGYIQVTEVKSDNLITFNLVTGQHKKVIKFTD